MSKTNYLRKRVLALFLALAMCLSLVQVTAFATEGEEQADAVITDTAEQDTDASAVEEDDENTSNAEETSEDISQKEGANEDISGEEESNEDTSDEKGLGEETSEEEEANEEASEEEESEEDASEEETPADDTLVCICETKCGEGSVKEDCPVCGAEDADLTACEGEEVPAEVSDEVPAQVQEFLDAVAALRALADEEDPDADAVLKAQNAVIKAYDALSEDQKSELGEDYATMVAELKEIVTLAEEPENWLKPELIETKYVAPSYWLGITKDEWDTHDAVEQEAAVKSLEPGIYLTMDLNLAIFKGPDRSDATASATRWTGIFSNYNSNSTWQNDHNNCVCRKAVQELVVAGKVDFSQSAYPITSSGGVWNSLKKMTFLDVDIPDATEVEGPDGNFYYKGPFTSGAGNPIVLTVEGGSIGAHAFSASQVGTATLHKVALGQGAFQSSMHLESVVLDGIETVPATAFQYCENLKTVQAEDATDIGRAAFKSCTSLKDLSLPKASSVGWGIVSNSSVETVTIGRPQKLNMSAFGFASSLKSVILGSSDYTWNVVKGDIGDSLFCEFNGEEPLNLTLNNVNFPDYKTSGNSAPFQNLGMGSNGRLHLTVNDGKLGKYTFYNCKQLSSVDLNNVTIADKQYPFYLTNDQRPSAAKMTAIIDGGSLGTNAFYGSSLTEVTLKNIEKLPKFSFAFSTNLEKVTMDETVNYIDGCAFEKCSRLKELTLNDGTQLGHINTYMGLLPTGENASVIAGLYDRVVNILKGRFDLDTSPEIEQLVRDTEKDWTSVTEGKKNDEWQDNYQYATQLIEHARWANPGTGASDNTVAEVRVDAYYTVPAQMDFIFVLDCSRSMSDLGDPSDMNARFYDMQSKLIDMTDKLLHSDSFYDCQVAFTTFGGAYNGATESGVKFVEGKHTNSNGFYGKEQYGQAMAFIQGMTPYYNNTDYGLGLQGALELAQSNPGRKTSVIFISDGRPYIGDNNEFEAESSGDYTGAATAEAIRALENVEIYGVLQSVPAGELADAQAAMKDVCTDGLFFTATDTDTFSQAVNRAIEASFGTLTLTLPVDPAFEGVIDSTLRATTDEGLLPDEESTVRYDAATKTITWTIVNLPFEKHTLTYQLRLAPRADGTYPEGSIPVNDPSKTVSLIWAEEGRPENPIDPPALSRTNPTTPVSPTVYRYRIDHVYYRNGTVNEGSRTGDVQEIGRVPDIGLVTSSDYQRTYNGRTYGAPGVSISNGPIDGVYVITLRYDRTTTPTPGPDPDPDPTPVTPTPTPIPDDPTPLGPGPDGTTIPDQEVPLAAPGLNSVDHYAYIIGYPDGLVHPEANVTRAEVATIFFRLMTDEFRTEHWATENPFLDVAAQEWFNNSVSTSSRAGIVKGYEDGSFRPNNNITRAEFAAIAARFLSDEVNISSSFSDISGHWAEKEIDRAVMAGWIKGYTDGTFRPDQPITRAEAVTMINRMLDRTPDKDHMLENMIRWDDNTEDKWYYADMQEATNSHDYERLEMILIEEWTELLENRDWAALQEEWATAASAPGGEVADNLDLSKIGENGAAQGAETAEPENA